MSIEIIISSAVAGAVVSLFGTIVAAKIAQKTAIRTVHESMSSDIKKMEKTWAREDVVSSDDEFAEMAASVAKFIQYNSPTNMSNALAMVAAARSKESGALGECLDHLYDTIRTNKQTDANQYLSMAINEKRKIKHEASPN